LAAKLTRQLPGRLTSSEVDEAVGWEVDDAVGREVDEAVGSEVGSEVDEPVDMEVWCGGLAGRLVATTVGHRLTLTVVWRKESRIGKRVDGQEGREAIRLLV
jgi:hypothetical protein